VVGAAGAVVGSAGAVVGVRDAAASVAGTIGDAAAVSNVDTVVMFALGIAGCGSRLGPQATSVAATTSATIHFIAMPAPFRKKGFDLNGGEQTRRTLATCGKTKASLELE
jgi:hypothetical protein